MVELLRNFLGGAVCGGAIGFFFPLIKNIKTCRRENKATAMDFLVWVLIGFLLGGAMGAVFFTPAWLGLSENFYLNNPALL